jgi:hypothetical protein
MRPRLRWFALIALAVGIGNTVFATAQEDVLQSSNPELRSLRSLRESLRTGVNLFDPLERVTSRDAQVLAILDEAASGADHELRGAIDLLAVYENMQCAPDRAMLKPLLEDRLRLYSRMLSLDAERAGIPLGTPGAINLPATSEKALKLRDNLLAAKSKLDTIAASLH